MTIELLVNSVDVTSDIISNSLTKADIINDKIDKLKFKVEKYGSVGFTPVIGQDVILNIDATKEFGGTILEIKKSIKSGQIVEYEILCVDHSFQLNRELVLERFDDQTVDYIIADIVAEYASDFTVVNVDCSETIHTMVFNRTTMSESLDKLAKEVGYYWYVDEDKDIHFFAKDTNAAPFEITDDNGNYLQNSLTIKDDLSQIRNSVIVRGSEERASERTESYIADGDQITFPLSNKFAELPTVTVQDQASTTTVGVDFLDPEDDYNCFWNFGQKYIRFKDGTKPAATKKVDITGIPLFPIIVQITDPVSIVTYGTYEHFKEDKSIQSREEGLTYAQAELTAYKDGIIEGKFKTDASGLRSGQIITINSTLLDINEDFLIQSVKFKLKAKDKGEWSIQLATMRTIGIIQVLQDLIRTREVREFDPENLLTLIQLDSTCKITAVISSTSATTTENYVWFSGAEPNPMVWNLCTWET